MPWVNIGGVMMNVDQNIADQYAAAQGRGSSASSGSGGLGVDTNWPRILAEMQQQVNLGNLGVNEYDAITQRLGLGATYQNAASNALNARASMYSARGNYTNNLLQNYLNFRGPSNEYQYQDLMRGQAGTDLPAFNRQAQGLVGQTGMARISAANLSPMRFSQANVGALNTGNPFRQMAEGGIEPTEAMARGGISPRLNFRARQQAARRTNPWLGPAMSWLNTPNPFRRFLGNQGGNDLMNQANDNGDGSSGGGGGSDTGDSKGRWLSDRNRFVKAQGLTGHDDIKGELQRRYGIVAGNDIIDRAFKAKQGGSWDSLAAFVKGDTGPNAANVGRGDSRWQAATVDTSLIGKGTAPVTTAPAATATPAPVFHQAQQAPKASLTVFRTHPDPVTRQPVIDSYVDDTGNVYNHDGTYMGKRRADGTVDPVGGQDIANPSASARPLSPQLPVIHPSDSPAALNTVNAQIGQEPSTGTPPRISGKGALYAWRGHRDEKGVYVTDQYIDSENNVYGAEGTYLGKAQPDGTVKPPDQPSTTPPPAVGAVVPSTITTEAPTEPAPPPLAPSDTSTDTSRDVTSPDQASAAPAVDTSGYTPSRTPQEEAEHQQRILDERAAGGYDLSRPGVSLVTQPVKFNFRGRNFLVGENNRPEIVGRGPLPTGGVGVITVPLDNRHVTLEAAMAALGNGLLPGSPFHAHGGGRSPNLPAYAMSVRRMAEGGVSDVPPMASFTPAPDVAHNPTPFAWGMSGVPEGGYATTPVNQGVAAVAQTIQQRPVLDSRGDVWVQGANGQWQNQRTGEVWDGMGDPSGTHMAVGGMLPSNAAPAPVLHGDVIAPQDAVSPEELRLLQHLAQRTGKPQPLTADLCVFPDGSIGPMPVDMQGGGEPMDMQGMDEGSADMAGPEDPNGPPLGGMPLRMRFDGSTPTRMAAGGMADVYNGGNMAVRRTPPPLGITPPPPPPTTGHIHPPPSLRPTPPPQYAPGYGMPGATLLSSFKPWNLAEMQRNPNTVPIYVNAAGQMQVPTGGSGSHASYSIMPSGDLSQYVNPQDMPSSLVRTMTPSEKDAWDSFLGYKGANPGDWWSVFGRSLPTQAIPAYARFGGSF